MASEVTTHGVEESGEAERGRWRWGLELGQGRGTLHHTRVSAGGAKSHKAETNPCPHTVLPPGSTGSQRECLGAYRLDRCRRGCKRDPQKPEPHPGHAFGFSEICLASSLPFIPERTKPILPVSPQPSPHRYGGRLLQGLALPSPSWVHVRHYTATLF